MAVDLLNTFVIFLSYYIAIIVLGYSIIQKETYNYLILHKARLNFNGCIGRYCLYVALVCTFCIFLK